MDAQLLIPLVLVMVAIGGAVFAVASGVHEKQVVRESLRSLDGYDMDGGLADARSQHLSESLGKRAVMPALGRLIELGRRLTPLGYVDKIRQKFVIAGIQTPDSVDRFLAVKRAKEAGAFGLFKQGAANGIVLLNRGAAPAGYAIKAGKPPSAAFGCRAADGGVAYDVPPGAVTIAQ